MKRYKIGYVETGTDTKRNTPYSPLCVPPCAPMKSYISRDSFAIAVASIGPIFLTAINSCIGHLSPDVIDILIAPIIMLSLCAG